MGIAWNPSRGATLGVEWELQLIDAQTRLLRQDAREVLASLPGLTYSGEHPRIRYELMQSTLEVVTGICSTVPEAKADLATTIEELQRITDARGTMLACAGTHPVSDWRDAKMAPIQRYAELVEEMQWLARRIQTFGVHVHVGVRDGGKAIPPRGVSSAFSRAHCVQPVLVRAGHRTGLGQIGGIRCAAHRRPAAPAGQVE